jgi:hypothetical protein
MFLLVHKMAAGRAGARRAAGLLIAGISMLGAVQLAVPGDAHALPGLERASEQSNRDNARFKLVPVDCPSGTLAIGGGFNVDDGFRNDVRLTQSRPSGAQWVVSAAAPPNADYTWKLTGFAICADADTLRDLAYQPVSNTVENPASSVHLPGTASCPRGKVAYSAGGSVDVVDGSVGLQMMRTSGPMDIARATGREDSGHGGTLKNWKLTVWAVCAKPDGGLHVEGEGPDPVDPSFASSRCDLGTYVHGPGGGASGPNISDPGPTWLKMLFPSSNLKELIVQMTHPNALLAAHHTCATRS